MSHVVVIGTGYAGVHAAAAARREGADVTLVDRHGRHDLITRLAAVAGGTAEPGDAWAPAEDLLGLPVVRGEVRVVDPAGPTVRFAERAPLTADAVVITVGSAPMLPPVPGLEEHTWSLRNASDALRLKRELADARRVVVVGGGGTGTQLAGETSAAHPDLHLTLVETEDALLPQFGGKLGTRAARILRGRGVDVRLGTIVERVDPDAAVTADDERLPADLVVWATGFAAHGTELLPDAAVRDGRLVVDRFLRVRERVLAAGDVAWHRDVFGSPLPMSAQIAVQGGAAAGRNAARLARGASPKPARLVDLGWVVTLGGGKGVARVGPVELSAPLVDRAVPLLHLAVDARHLRNAAGIDAVARYFPGRHRPDDAALRQVARPQLRAVS